ncbi:MAG: hypothetical protein R6X13_11270, partial [bacterium]
YLASFYMSDGTTVWSQAYSRVLNESRPDQAYAVVYGNDTRVYMAGRSTDGTTAYDITVTAHDAQSGVHLWTLVYDGPDHDADEASAMVHGQDGNLYVAGRAQDVATTYNFTVLSLGAYMAVNEAGLVVVGPQRAAFSARFDAGGQLLYTLTLPKRAVVRMSLCSPEGAVLRTWWTDVGPGGVRGRKPLPALASGTYFCRVEAGYFAASSKAVKF